MSVTGFSVTFERWDNAAVEAGDTDDRGYVVQGVSLTDAVRLGLEVREPAWVGPCEPSCSDMACARWLLFSNWNKDTHEYFRTGITEDRALHIPDQVTTASRKRIARLFGVR